ncbi:MAG TPA: HlyD family efflux transporter periplasmic adaptor subunit [Candidatus Aenigmarchaeota archaeon]|nr:HlyD family efflux transporter periplasmic adaptor subunit [Candidatus Aenigmarchaeota archaeon]
MRNKLFGLAGTIGIIILGIIIASTFASQKKAPPHRVHAGSTKTYKTETVQIKETAPVFNTGGVLQAYNKIILFAEVSGILHEADTPFRGGSHFKAGQVILKIDDRVYRNNVLAQKSSLLNQLTLFLPDLAIDYPQSVKKWQSYLDNFELNQPLAPLPAASHTKEKYFIASRNIYSLYYQVKSMEETLAKYTIRAPYKGIVTEADITAGSLVRAGQKLGEFTNVSAYEIAMPVNLSHLPFLKIGDRVILTSEDLPETFIGKIHRINEKIDRGTQTVQVFISVSSPKLKDGMYMNASIEASRGAVCATVPEKWLVNGNGLYILQDSSFVLRPVQIILSQKDNVMVHGLKQGEIILAQEVNATEPVVPADKMH